MFNSPSPTSPYAHEKSSIAQITYRDELDTAWRRRNTGLGRIEDILRCSGIFTLKKYHPSATVYDTLEDFYAHETPYSITQHPNGLLLVGVQAMFAMLIGTGTSTANSAYATPTYYSAAQACIGVGDSTTAFANTQTGLQAATNKAYEPMAATYPSIGTGGTANQITFQSSFGGTSGNFAWQEAVVYNSPASTTNSVALGSNAIALNRAVSSMGTKVASSTWQLSYVLTIS